MSSVLTLHSYPFYFSHFSLCVCVRISSPPASLLVLLSSFHRSKCAHASKRWGNLSGEEGRGPQIPLGMEEPISVVPFCWGSKRGEGIGETLDRKKDAERKRVGERGKRLRRAKKGRKIKSGQRRRERRRQWRWPCEGPLSDRQLFPLPRLSAREGSARLRQRKRASERDRL